MRNAQGFAQKKEYPVATRVTRVIDGGEPAEFKSLFRDWKDKNETVGFGKQFHAGRVAKMAPTTFDVTQLHDQPKLASDSGMVDDGTGDKIVYRVIDFDLEQLPVSEHGKFFAGDCYVIVYSYYNGGREKNIIYYWLVGWI